MHVINDEQALSILTQSEFGEHAPFEFLYPKEPNGFRNPDTRHGDHCYVLHSKKDGMCYYVLLDGTIEQEKSHQ